MKKKFIYIGSVVVVLAIVFFVYRYFAGNKTAITVETSKIEKGTISNTITATGTLEAVKTVEVGTQVSGVIEKIFVDFNSQVKRGQLLALLDETPLLAQLEQSKSSVDQAEAQVKYQKATFERYKALIVKKLIAQSDFDLAEYNYSNAAAGLNNAKSVYDKNKINLSYARIYSPIDGIILERAVDEGQTVAASFSTPTLFTIANDLTQMRVEANIDEADIGQVCNNQRVEFTVDAFPLKKFSGLVTEIRLQPVESSNVITYTVIINAPNPEKILMPGMTANATFFVTEAKNILLVPAKAIRFKPDSAALESYNESVLAGNKQIGERSEPRMESGAPKFQKSDEKRQVVWVKQGDIIHPQNVTLGVTDEINYEVVSGLKEGDEVVVSMNTESVVQSGSAPVASQSPFMPKRPDGNKKSNK
ncbi:efflux RND transporter periplasmic adaptor subunit [Labilibaculum sp.]|uniref:efflux RND transporter periplasmic adaptor subunit n=1 Tax=Labilibaculum sp. TaxID=2060723 RepID=UPI002AA74E68|nr:efflux RND transporter periplasmic adaptor subunit [Labilibaculum sp.]MBN2598529.1 efflux RND transporter periplasmic adaptor subunit [Marinifilaceae bacterium]